MTDAACFDLAVNLLMIVGLIMFYRTMHNAALAIIILTCGADHGHGAEHDLPCDCKCH